MAYIRHEVALKQLEAQREKGVCCALPAVDAQWATDTADLLKALADPTRVTMVAALGKAKSPVCICDFTADLGLAQATVSHHMARLREAGLVDCEKKGIWTYYWLRKDMPAGARKLLAQLISS